MDKQHYYYNCTIMGNFTQEKVTIYFINLHIATVLRIIIKTFLFYSTESKFFVFLEHLLLSLSSIKVVFNIVHQYKIGINNTLN